MENPGRTAVTVSAVGLDFGRVKWQRLWRHHIVPAFLKHNGGDVTTEHKWLAVAHPTELVPPHEQEPAVAPYLETITWRRRAPPIPSLQVQLAVAERRGLTHRGELIRQAMAP